MEIREIILLKGTYEILNALCIIPKRYNEIKREVKEIISSRTLDSRLREMINTNCLKKQNSQISQEEGEYYEITKKGQYIWSIFKTLEQMQTNNIVKNQEKFFAKILEFQGLIVKKVEQMGWNKIWKEIQKIMPVESKITTINSGKENIIRAYLSKGIIVETKHSTELVKIEDLKHAWEHLQQTGTLYMKDYKNASYRSSFVCALFANIEGIQTSKSRPYYLFIS